MRRRAAFLGAVVALALGAGSAGGARADSHAVARASCSASYVTAHLSWGVKCLRAGEFCKVGNAEYKRYGFVCPATGHLERR
jgi:hypothetical protein